MAEQDDSYPFVAGGTLLVAMDGSQCSWGALQAAISMAKACGGETRLRVVTVVELYEDQLEHAPELEEKLAADAHRLLEEVAQHATWHGVECETVAHVGAPVHQHIINEAERGHATLIAIGSHGRSGLRRLLMGSTAQRVVGHAPCAVLTVPERAVPEGSKKK